MEDNKSDSPTKSLLEMGEAKNISPTKSLSELEDDLDNPMNEEARQKATLADLDQTYESDKSQEHKPPVRRFGVQMGLFSKFTNAPTLDEFTLAKILGQIVDSPDKLDIIKEEASLKKQTTSKEDQSPPQRLQSLWSFQGSEYEAPDVGDLEDQKHEYLGWYKFSIASVIFATQFGIVNNSLRLTLNSSWSIRNCLHQSAIFKDGTSTSFGCNRLGFSCYVYHHSDSFCEYFCISSTLRKDSSLYNHDFVANGLLRLCLFKSISTANNCGT